MNEYQECLDRLYYTTTTNASGITRKEAYKKLQELITYKEEAEEYATKAEETFAELEEERNYLLSQIEELTKELTYGCRNG